MIDKDGYSRGSDAAREFRLVRRKLYLAFARGDMDRAFKLYVMLVALSENYYREIQTELNRTQAEREATDTL